jgi:predicted nucleotidyltransferase
MVAMTTLMSPIERIITARTDERLACASRLASLALGELERRGIKAWIAGSLARGTFGPASDVDFVIDADGEAFDRAHAVIDEVMDGFPYDLIAWSRTPAEWRSTVGAG